MDKAGWENRFVLRGQEKRRTLAAGIGGKKHTGRDSGLVTFISRPLERDGLICKHWRIRHEQSQFHID
jgi:hypothetical protein